MKKYFKKLQQLKSPKGILEDWNNGNATFLYSTVPAFLYSEIFAFWFWLVQVRLLKISIHYTKKCFKNQDKKRISRITSLIGG